MVQHPGGGHGGECFEMKDEPHASILRDRLALANASPRCGARRRDGETCQGAAMPNGRCRMHGGKSPGAPKGEANGNYRHGRFTREAIERRRNLNALIRMLSNAAEEIA